MQPMWVNDAATRLAKHQAAVTAIRSTDEHSIVYHLLAYHLPQEPNPHQPMAKRTWEASVMAWRNTLQALAATIDLSF